MHPAQESVLELPKSNLQLSPSHWQTKVTGKRTTGTGIDNFLHESGEMEELDRTSDDGDHEWKPSIGDHELEGLDDDGDGEVLKKRRNRSNFSKFIGNSRRKRRRRTLNSINNNERMKKVVQQFKYASPLQRRLPPPTTSVNGQTLLLSIKPLQIPEAVIQRAQSFIIKREEGARIQVVPKFKKSLHPTPKLNNNSIFKNSIMPRSRTKGPNSLNRGSISREKSPNSSSSAHEPDPSKTSAVIRPKASLQHCANCNVKFTKIEPKISNFRINDDLEISATIAFKKIFQLQLQNLLTLVNIEMNEDVGLCSSCWDLISRIYSAALHFTTKRTVNSYFHKVAADTLKIRCNNNGSEMYSQGKGMCDKSTNYPVDEILPHYPAEPVMPSKLEDYSRVTALCDICGAGLTKEAGLKTHLLLTHSISRDEKSKDFVCKFCGKAYFFQYLLKNHMAVHSDDKPFSCPKDNCNAMFKSRASLRTHRIEVHELREQGQTFDCKFCDKKYLRARDLRDHALARHSEKPMFECPYCQRSFHRKKNIKTHKCPTRPPQSMAKKEAKVISSGNEEESLSQHSHVLEEDIGTAVSNEDIVEEDEEQHVSDKSSSTITLPCDLEKALESLQNHIEHHPPEPVLHIDVHGSLVRPTQPQHQMHHIPILGQQSVNVTSATSNTVHRPQLLTPSTVQYSIHPIQISSHQLNNTISQQVQVLHQQQQSQPQQHQQIYRINLGPHVLQGDQIVYETVNFLDIFNNDARQQQQNSNNNSSASGSTNNANTTFYQNILR